MKTYDEFITEAAGDWLDMLRSDAPREMVEKFTEEELLALCEYLAKATFRLYVGGAEQGYSVALMDDLLERDTRAGEA
jgi:hypothetical protein